MLFVVAKREVKVLCVTVTSFCMVLYGGNKSEAAQPDNISTKTPPSPMVFVLDKGGNYPLCRDYVDMLNKTKYLKPPTCSWTLLKEFSVFRGIPWRPVQDESEMDKVFDASVKINLVGAYDPEGKRRKRYYQLVDQYIEENGYPNVFQAQIDMDYDGKAEKVYQLDWGEDENLECRENKSFIVLDEADEYEDYANKGYLGLAFRRSVYRLFYYDGRVYKDYWQNPSSDYILKVNEIHGRSNEVCGINVLSPGQ